MVVIIDGTPMKSITSPFRAPTPKAARREMIHAGIAPMKSFPISITLRTPENPASDANDISNSPAITTVVSPIARIPVMLACLIIDRIFLTL